MKNKILNLIKDYANYLGVSLEPYEIVFIDDKLQFPYESKFPKIIINLASIEQYGYAFVKNVVIHELYHLLIQGIRGNRYMQAIRSQFSEIHAYTADIEADVVAFKYLNQYENVSLMDFYLAQYEGRGCFTTTKKQKWYYYPRSIGSMLSIFHFAFSGSQSVFVPSLETVNMDALMPVLQCKAGTCIYRVIELPDIFYEQKLIRLYHIDYHSFEEWFSEMTNVSLELLERMKLLDASISIYHNLKSN